MMGLLQELLRSDHRGTLEFFAVGLRDVSETAIDEYELMYNASVLAHYAQVAIDLEDERSTPTDLSMVYDRFIGTSSTPCDADIMEAAGAQCLLLAGFFEEQMRRRHNIRWYAEAGAGFYRRAAAREESARKAQLLGTIGKRFELWRQRHARLSRELRDMRFLLSTPSPPRRM
jgi:hypothetical protein